MTAILILAGVAVVIVATVVLVAVPVRHVEAVAESFTWRRSVRIGTRVWVKKRSRRKPRTSNETRNLVVQNADDPKKVRYLYEERVWRYTRTASASGSDQETVHDPQYTLIANQEARGKQASYQARFFSERDGHYTARVRFAYWKSLRAGATYRLGRNAFGRVRTVKPARSAAGQRTPQSAQQDP
jgi:hypothetical protein